MFFIRISIILISLLLITSFEVSFAATGSVLTESGITNIKSKDTEKSDKETNKETNKEKEILTNDDLSDEEEKIEEKKTEKNAQNIILEVYKIQGNKILKDMDISIEKLNPDPKIRIDIYSSIQKTLELRKIKVEK